MKTITLIPLANNLVSKAYKYGEEIVKEGDLF